MSPVQSGNNGFPWLGEGDFHDFPDPRRGRRQAPLARGGNLSPGMLLSAYRQGIFPWYSDGPIQWWCPDPRFIIPLAQVHFSRSLLRTLRRGIYTVTFDTCFDRVIEGCSLSPRPGQDGTWIVEEMRRAYNTLHELGYAHSVETWRDGELVGGLYGVSVGDTFCGESMFSKADDASKVAFWHLCQVVASRGIPVIDSQVHTDLFESLGAVHVARNDYLEYLAPRTRELKGALYGSWQKISLGEK